MISSLVYGIALCVHAGQAAIPTKPPEPALVQALVRQLDDPRFSARQQAEHKLIALGIGVVPQLRQQLQTRPPLEVYRRLEGIIDELARIKWHHDLDEARRAASRTGKPILVLSTLGNPDGNGSLASRALLSRTFTDLELVDYLNRHFVAVWHDQADVRWDELSLLAGGPLDGTPPEFRAEEVAAYAEGRGAPILHSYFCTPEGRVVFGLQGFWGKARYRAEADFARQLIAQTDGASAERRADTQRFLLTQRGEALARQRQGDIATALAAETLERSLLSNGSLDQPVRDVVSDLAKQNLQFSYG